MPDVICTTVYQFPELSDAAKDKARSWYRELGPHDDWWDAVYDDFERVCEIRNPRHPPQNQTRPPDGRRHTPKALCVVLWILLTRRWRVL